MGLNTIAAGKARFVLVVGVEKMTELRRRRGRRHAAQGLLRRARRPTSRAASPASSARSPRPISSATATSPTRSPQIAAKNHKNGAANPYAQMQKELGYEFCRTPSDKNPIVAGPLKRTDCSLVSDGAAAVVLADVDDGARAWKARRLPRRRAGQRLPADEQARHHQVRGPGAGLEAGAGRGPARPATTSPSSRRHDCFTSPS